MDLGQRTALGSCHNVSLASQDVSGSLILLNHSDHKTQLGNEDEFPDEMFQTPTLGSDADEVSPSSPIFAVGVEISHPSTALIGFIGDRYRAVSFGHDRGNGRIRGLLDAHSPVVCLWSGRAVPGYARNVSRLDASIARDRTLGHHRG